MKMKAILNPKFKKYQVISLQDSSSDDEEGKQSKELESVLHQVLNNIDQSLRKVPDLIPKDSLHNVRDEDMEENTTSLFTKIEVGESSKKQAECNEEVIANLNEKNIAYEESEDEMKEFEQEKDRRAIDHFRIQNEHISQINDGLTKANMMLKQDLQEVNMNYAELIQVVEELVKRRKVMQEHNAHLEKDKQKLKQKLKHMQKELKRIQKKSHALDGLATLAEATRRL